MQTYVGFGFDVNDLDKAAWVALVKKYDAAAYKDIEEQAAIMAEEENEELEEILKDGVLDFIDGTGMSNAEYLAAIINEKEKAVAGTDCIVAVYDDFVVFDSVRFADDSKRTQYIKTQEDFIVLIDKYVPIERIEFGNLFEGSEWTDPCFSLE